LSRGGVFPPSIETTTNKKELYYKMYLSNCWFRYGGGG
jgi:hypothetical protein